MPLLFPVSLFPEIHLSARAASEQDGLNYYFCRKYCMAGAE
jgi:hypothetical protein